MTREQANEGYSLSEQEERLTKYCEAMGWELIRVFIDPGYTGANMERPALKEMISEIEKGNADIILVDKLDRLSRSQFDTLYLIQKVFNENECAFVSRAESFDTSTAFGRAMVGILSVFAELERERIKERMNDGKEGRAKEGKYKGGGRTPIGYDYNPETGALEPNQYEAMQVKKVFEMFNARVPVYSIMREMNEKGYRTKYGDWKETTIRNMVQNKVYLGKILHNGEYYDGLHEPILSEEVFNRAESICQERDRKFANSKYGRRHCSPLGGLVWCGKCGARYHYRTNGSRLDGTKRGYYACYSRSKADKGMVKDPHCKNKTHRDYRLENVIYGEIKKLKSDPAYFNLIKKSVDNNDNRDAIESRIEKIKEQVSRFMDLYSVGTIDINMIREKIDALEQERKTLESDLEEMNRSEYSVTQEGVEELVDIFERTLAEGNSYKIHDVIMELIDRIELEDDEIRIHWNF